MQNTHGSSQGWSALGDSRLRTRIEIGGPRLCFRLQVAVSAAPSSLRARLATLRRRRAAPQQHPPSGTPVFPRRRRHAGVWQIAKASGGVGVVGVATGAPSDLPAGGGRGGGGGGGSWWVAAWCVVGGGRRVVGRRWWLRRPRFVGLVRQLRSLSFYLSLYLEGPSRGNGETALKFRGGCLPKAWPDSALRSSDLDEHLRATGAYVAEPELRLRADPAHQQGRWAAAAKPGSAASRSAGTDPRPNPSLVRPSRAIPLGTGPSLPDQRRRPYESAPQVDPRPAPECWGVLVQRVVSRSLRS